MSSSRFAERCTPLAALAAICVYLASSTAAWAVPSFARQTGLACEACHTVFPALTHFGRVFKANGYVLENIKQIRDVDEKKSELLELGEFPPLSIMLQASYTELSKSLPDLAADGIKFDPNGTAQLPQQLSLFYAGKIAPHMGGFIQITYAQPDGTFGMDNTDIRLANLSVLSNKQTLTYGLSLNNNPTVQDIYNSTPAFGFPWQSSSATVSSLATPQIYNNLGGNVAGLTGYLWWNESLYAEFGGYVAANQGATNTITGAAGPLDGFTSNVLNGTAPYWRLAYEYNHGPHSIEVGTYGMSVGFYPGDGVPLSGPDNHFTDVAEDLQYQYLGDQHSVMVTFTNIHESQDLKASYNAEDIPKAKNDLTSWNLAGTYYWRRMLGGTVQYFSTTGNRNAGLYPSPDGTTPADGVITSAKNSPNTAGWNVELDYLPWLNTKFTLLYTAYNSFNGGSRNYDGVGRSASDNNSLYFLLWFSY